MMKVTVTKYLNVRVGKPSLNAPCYQYLAPGSEIEVDGKLYKGDKDDGIYEGINTWFKDESENYYWSGGFAENQDLKSLPWWMIDLKLPYIWETYKEKGANTKIAILDSGYNISNTEIKVVDSINTVGGNTTINDNYGHGSCCASLIGGRNNKYIIGCAPDSQLYIGKITESGSLKNEKLYDAINWAIRKQVDIISISYGGNLPNDNLRSLIQSAVAENNILVIASIGDNYPEQGQAGGLYPALFEDCLAVGATGRHNKLSKVSMVNSKTEINAPGEEIDAFLKKSFPEKTPNGTSQAAAIVAGICALVISQYKTLGKPYSPISLKKLITQNFDTIPNSLNQKLISPVKIFSNL